MYIRFIITLVITLSLTLSYGQNARGGLKHVSNNFTSIEINKRLKNRAIIYGNFILRENFTTVKDTEYIIVKNIESGKEYSFVVKNVYNKRKSIPFLYFIPEGEYQILKYGAIIQKPLGYKFYTEPIFKKFNHFSEQNKKKIKEGLIDIEAQEKFTFTVKNNTINYLGSWNFDRGYINFFDDKLKLDKKMKIKINKKIDYKNAIINFPK